jgi:cytidylate kinase
MSTCTQRLPVVAIDGPAGAGKSTLAAHLARRFGLLNLESGAMYRALALKAIEHDLDLGDESAMADLTTSTRIELSPTIEGNRVRLDGTDVTRRLRDEDVTQAASMVSIHPRVRRWMVDEQRKLGTQGGVVMEGRDIGTVVFPDAEVKIFLDAAPEVRGNRRYQQAAQPSVTEESVLREIRDRDQRDRSRAASPLVAAPDAVIIDSTKMSLDEVIAAAEAVVLQHVRVAPAPETRA